MDSASKLLFNLYSAIVQSLQSKSFKCYSFTFLTSKFFWTVHNHFPALLVLYCMSTTDWFLKSILEETCLYFLKTDNLNSLRMNELRDGGCVWIGLVMSIIHSGSSLSAVLVPGHLLLWSQDRTACVFTDVSPSLAYRCAHRLVKLRGFIYSESEAVMSRCCLPPALFSERRPGFVLEEISVAS